jgi:hypothetical protein
LKSKFDLTLNPLELAIENGIGLGLGRIIRKELSLRFLLDLKKPDINVFSCPFHRYHVSLSN